MPLATGGGRVISGGNFHGEPIALALDFAKLALAELGAISERRTALLVDPRLNGGLPPFLAPDPGQNSGLMIVQYGGGPRLENKVLAHPSSADSIPDQRQPGGPRVDGGRGHGTPGPLLGHVQQIVAIELLRRGPGAGLSPAPTAPTAPQLGPAGVAEAHARCAGPFLAGDREPGADLAATLRLVAKGRSSTSPASRRPSVECWPWPSDRRCHRRRHVFLPPPCRSRVRPPVV